jgi:hypothetical protein
VWHTATPPPAPPPELCGAAALCNATRVEVSMGLRLVVPACRLRRGATEGVAEREGFEPSMTCAIPHFQCGALGH